MTKEELEKEARTECFMLTINTIGIDQRDVELAYIMGAEPREKRIEELIALINAERERQEKCDDVHLRTIAELEKENAELKGLKDGATLIRANNDTVTTLMQLNNMLVSKSQQLTKAKDHIKKLLDCLKQDTNDPQTNYYVCQYMDKAEQFLNGGINEQEA